MELDLEFSTKSKAEFAGDSDNSFEDLGSDVYQLQFKKSSSDFEEITNDEINQVPKSLTTGGIDFRELIKNQNFDFRTNRKLKNLRK